MMHEDRWQDVEPALKLARKEGLPFDEHIYSIAISVLDKAKQFEKGSENMKTYAVG
jgi:hypothetical protein